MCARERHQGVISMTEGNDDSTHLAVVAGHRELDDLGGKANSLASLGLSYRLLGDHA
jgi:hypothetical protein